MCRKIWNSGIWPKDWKRTTFIPIPKKGNLKECTNYRTVALISHASKILLKIIMGRIQKKLKEEINIAQAGFTRGRGTRDHILNMRTILEKCREYNIDLYTCFIDYSKAFDCVQHQTLWKIMSDMGFTPHLVHLIKTLYEDQQATVRIENETSEWFSIGQGVRQGCILSPYLFNIYAENIMRNVRESDNEQFEALKIGGHALPELRYADDTALLSTSLNGIEKMIASVQKYSEKQNLYLNIAKTKIFTTDKMKETADIYVNDQKIERVDRFEYLGSLITNDGKSIKEIKRRLNIAMQKIKQLQNIWKGTDNTTKLRFLRACIFSIATYGCETWTIDKSAERSINAFECKCYRKILRVSWTERRTNMSILQQLSIPENWLLKNIKTRKIKYFGHIKRHGGLERIIMEGMVPGKRSRGRPRRRWTQDIIDELGMTAADAGHLAQNRENFRRVVMGAKFQQGQAKN